MALEEYDKDGNMISFGGPIDWTSLGQTVDAPLSVDEATLYGEFNKPKQPAKSVPKSVQKKASSVLADALGIMNKPAQSVGDERYMPSQRDRRGIAGMLDTMAESSGYNVSPLSGNSSFVGMRQDQLEDQLAGMENRQATLAGRGADARRQAISDVIGDAEGSRKFGLTANLAQLQGAESIADRLTRVLSQKPDNTALRLFEAISRKRVPSESDQEAAKLLLNSLMGR